MKSFFENLLFYAKLIHIQCVIFIMRLSSISKQYNPWAKISEQWILFYIDSACITNFYFCHCICAAKECEKKNSQMTILNIIISEKKPFLLYNYYDSFFSSLSSDSYICQRFFYGFKFFLFLTSDSLLFCFVVIFVNILS